MAIANLGTTQGVVNQSSMNIAQVDCSLGALLFEEPGVIHPLVIDPINFLLASRQFVGLVSMLLSPSLLKFATSLNHVPLCE